MERFGEIPAPAMNLLKIVKIKARCSALDAELVSFKDGVLKVYLSPRAGINTDAVPDLLKHYGRKMKLKFSGKAPVFEMDLKNLSQEKALKETEELITVMRRLLLSEDASAGE
jgi:transcription-repair coupling factor (superfamily II helicase)